MNQYLPDALGSVRQVLTATGLVLTKSYDPPKNGGRPYGEVIYSNGAETSYGFTGEQHSATGLVYLRARTYNPITGTFTSRDTWEGDANLPMSYNRWLYTNGNPVNYTDPSGLIAIDENDEANSLIELLHSKYGILVQKDWGEITYLDPISQISTCGWIQGAWHSSHEIELVKDAVERITKTIPDSKFKKVFSGVKIKKWVDSGYPWTNFSILAPLVGQRSWAPPFGDTIFLTDNGVFQTNDDRWIVYVIIHEFGHIWDFRSGEKLSIGMANSLGTISCSRNNPSSGCIWDINTGKEKPPGTRNPSTNYAATDKWEDWAEAFANTIYPYYQTNDEYRSIGKLRKKFVLDQIQEIK